MLRKDYIMRMIELLGQAIAEVVLKRKAKDEAAAQQLLDQVSTEHLGLPLTLVISQPPSQLKAMLSLDGELDPGKCLVAGELFGQAAALRQHHGEAEALRLKSLDFFMSGYRVLPEKERRLYAEKIATLIETLEDHAFEDQERLRFVLVYEAAHRYDQAEDLLFELLDAGVEGALERGLKLYQRLLYRKDEDLERGGLPREEVEQGLRELESRAGPPA